MFVQSLYLRYVQRFFTFQDGLLLFFFVSLSSFFFLLSYFFFLLSSFFFLLSDAVQRCAVSVGTKSQRVQATEPYYKHLCPSHVPKTSPNIMMISNHNFRRPPHAAKSVATKPAWELSCKFTRTFHHRVELHLRHLHCLLAELSLPDHKHGNHCDKLQRSISTVFSKHAGTVVACSQGRQTPLQKYNAAPRLSSKRGHWDLSLYVHRDINSPGCTAPAAHKAHSQQSRNLSLKSPITMTYTCGTSIIFRRDVNHRDELQLRPLHCLNETP